MGDYGASFLTSLGEWASEYGATTLQAVGTAAQVGSAIQQADAQAKLGEEQAALINEETRLTREASQRRYRQVIGRNRAVAAGAGVDPFSGSPLEIELANAFEQGMNEELETYSGKSRAYQARLGAHFQRRAIPGMAIGGAAQIGSSVMGDWYKKTRGTGTYKFPSMKDLESSWT